ncbi:type I CRISPR-associated protein Cas7 [Paraneptunicella aestuarii]|uniref:type I CRISPR-associated protein Cas7 n=1 Tax=Paraneptunicella aestuarii TaxID=2831148 RepID=UPI001E65B5E1|nr:type I CRISPR-associated protein Cas7 [Paraneptunicella aestuarii]UAA40147.1 type I CRISPR-associated protein Cas7 [Paraneptunicella aestuarii]
MNAPFNRQVGLIVLDVTMSNPNGDPDMDSEPRTRDLDQRGMISPVSFKRKFRDLVAEDSPVFEEALSHLKLGKSGNEFGILEQRGRDRDAIKKLDRDAFVKSYWDARLFGNTFLESMKDSDAKDRNVDHFISTGALQIGVGLSVAPVDVVRMTTTNKSGVQEGKDRGMAPLGFKVVQHGVYCIPIYVNPSVAKKTGATQEDLDLFKFMLPYVYQHTTSAIRPQISVLHAWFAEHKNVLGSCPEHLLIDALTPKLKEGVETPVSLSDYHVPTLADVDPAIIERFAKVEDLNNNI